MNEFQDINLPGEAQKGITLNLKLLEDVNPKGSRKFDDLVEKIAKIHSRHKNPKTRKEIVRMLVSPDYSPSGIRKVGKENNYHYWGIGSVVASIDAVLAQSNKGSGKKQEKDRQLKHLKNLFLSRGMDSDLS